MVRHQVSFPVPLLSAHTLGRVTNLHVKIESSSAIARTAPSWPIADQTRLPVMLSMAKILPLLATYSMPLAYVARPPAPIVDAQITSPVDPFIAKYPVRLPTYTVPRPSITGDVMLMPPGATTHAGTPVTPLRANSVPSSDPVTTVPSTSIAADAITLAFVLYDHVITPVGPSSAYTLLSSDPTKTVPSASTAGDDSTLPGVARVHTTAPASPVSAYTR